MTTWKELKSNPLVKSGIAAVIIFSLFKSLKEGKIEKWVPTRYHRFRVPNEIVGETEKLDHYISSIVELTKMIKEVDPNSEINLY